MKLNDDNIGKLVLLNDEVNQYEFVIKSLMDVCEFEELQAEQITALAHFNGKVIIKEGNIHTLTPIYYKLSKKGLILEIISSIN